jgi:hypothetical protein
MRRILGVSVAVMFLAGVATAQAPAKIQPHATLAQLMRGVFFPNSNILFDVQSGNPEDIGKKQEGAGASASFSGIYTGWPMVENAALALAEGASLLTVPGRMCENGRPVPLDRADWPKFVAEMQTAALTMYKAAQSRNQERASDATNDVAGACENCHMVYRERNPRCVPAQQ